MPISKPFREERFAKLREIRVEGGEAGTPFKLIGYAAVFDSLSVPLGSPDDESGVFYETIVPGAFGDTLATSDVVALWNHEDRLVLGRVKAGTLKLWEDERGLCFECTLPNTSYARDLVELIRCGNVDGCSFGFNCEEQDQDVTDNGGGLPLRSLKRVELIEISLGVTFPAYPEAYVALRSAAVAQWRTSKAASDPSRLYRSRLKRALRRLASS